MRPTLIWDLPTRVFHWSLVCCFVGAWLTSESDTWLSVHVFLGYLMLGLVGFRVVWGLVGTHHARFSSFWFGPRAALTYLRQVLAHQAARHVGHNPTGSLAIYLLLLLAVVVGATGVFTLGGEEQQGAAASWLSFSQGRWAKKLHEGSAIAMLLLVLGHLAGVVVESLQHRENLARAMLTGTKLADADSPKVRPHAAVAAVLLVLMAGFGGWWFWYALQAPLEPVLGKFVPAASAPQVKFVGPKLADNAQWRDECGSCHGVFHPSLLPARSWARVMAEQQQHFGSDLGLDAPTTAAILDFMRRHAADGHATEAALKIDRSIPPTEAPLRITETGYWLKKHREVKPAEWARPSVKSKANCGGCHADADAGTYEDGAMKIPPP